MRLSIAFLMLVAGVLAGCSRHPPPPQGRWEGTYESADAMIVARVEVEPNGRVRVSAPDYSNLASASEDERKQIRANLAAGLEDGWDSVAPRTFDFDGAVFRKPGGIAPQMKWDAGKKHMSLVVYLGANPGIEIPLRAVDNFSEDPWAG